MRTEVDWWQRTATNTFHSCLTQQCQCRHGGHGSRDID